MANILSSWKEIAAYLGKGVRTVQRWEHEFGLPIRRPSPDRSVIIADCDELDSWIKRQCKRTMENDVDELHAELERLKTENDDLRALIAKFPFTPAHQAYFADHGRKYRILVVEDNEIHSYVLEKQLTFSGFSVDRAATGNDAISAAATRKPHAVLLDVHLPDINGFDVCRRLRENAVSSDLAIVFYTATGSGGQTDAVQAGGDAYLTFPVEATQLVSVINSCIARRAC